MIIDAHSHLGNILERGGGLLIDRRGVAMERVFDPQAVMEAGMNRTFGLGPLPYLMMRRWVTRAERARNETATLENMGRSLDGAGVDYTVCLPIAPHVTFDDLLKARGSDGRVIPFTSVDFSGGCDYGKKLAEDVRRGAMGLKLHPIIQKVPLEDPRTMEALQAFEPLGKPVLTHAGVFAYYPEDQRDRNLPELGGIHHVEAMVRSFPGIRFIVGHSGLFQVREVMRRLRGCRNVWVDTSFQSPLRIRKLVETFGTERVLYASDWPFGFRRPALKCLRAACRGDRGLERRILSENAKELLGLSL